MYLQEVQTTRSGELECVHFDLERMGNQLLECSIGTGDPSTRSKSGKRHFRAHLTGDIEGRCTKQMEIFLAYFEIRLLTTKNSIRGILAKCNLEEFIK